MVTSRSEATSTKDEGRRNRIGSTPLRERKRIFLGGLSERFSPESKVGIPALWQRFTAQLANIPDKVGHTAYGVCYHGDERGNFDYLCGVEVTPSSELPPGMRQLQIPKQRYAVFHQPGHISRVGPTWDTLWNRWRSGWGERLSDQPAFERYDEKFDPASGRGGFEIWMPVQG